MKALPRPSPGNLPAKLYRRQTVALLLLIWAPLLLAQNLAEEATQASSPGTEAQVSAAPAEKEPVEENTFSGYDLPPNAELQTSSSKPELTPQVVALIRPVEPTQPPAPSLHRRNRKLLLGTEIFKWAALVADVESTRAGLNSGRCVETNPLFGRNPSRLRMYAISLPVLGLQTWLGKRQQKRNGSSKFWTVSNLFIGGMHSYAAVHNSRCF